MKGAGLTLCGRPLNHKESGSVITTIICLHVAHSSGVDLLGTYIPDPSQVSAQKLVSFQRRTLLNEGIILRTSLEEMWEGSEVGKQTGNKPTTKEKVC